MGDQGLRGTPCIGVGRTRSAGPAQTVMTKIGGRCPPYAVEENVLPDSPHGAFSMSRIHIGWAFAALVCHILLDPADRGWLSQAIRQTRVP